MSGGWEGERAGAASKNGQSKSEETLVSSAMRLIASPSKGATVSARTLPLSLTASVGWIESVMTSSVSSLASTRANAPPERSEEQTSELQSLMRISYAVFCWHNKQKHNIYLINHN